MPAVQLVLPILLTAAYLLPSKSAKSAAITMTEQWMKSDSTTAFSPQPKSLIYTTGPQVLWGIGKWMKPVGPTIVQLTRSSIPQVMVTMATPAQTLPAQLAAQLESMVKLENLMVAMTTSTLAQIHPWMT